MADQEIIHKTEYIERKKIEKFFDGIYDCADLTFEPNDHCCTADDCAHCKWRETMNAIQKRILFIPAADVRPVILCRDCRNNCHCMIQDFMEDYGVTPNDQNNFFCGYGEREE